MRRSSNKINKTHTHTHLRYSIFWVWATIHTVCVMCLVYTFLIDWTCVPCRVVSMSISLHYWWIDENNILSRSCESRKSRNQEKQLLHHNINSCLPICQVNRMSESHLRWNEELTCCYPVSLIFIGFCVSCCHFVVVIRCVSYRISVSWPANGMTGRSSDVLLWSRLTIHSYCLCFCLTFYEKSDRTKLQYYCT